MGVAYAKLRGEIQSVDLLLKEKSLGSILERKEERKERKETKE